MYGVGGALPAVYTERFRTQIYNERVVHPGVWNKIVVVAREDDDEAILNHALIQKPTAPPDVGTPQPVSRAGHPAAWQGRVGSEPWSGIPCIVRGTGFS